MRSVALLAAFLVLVLVAARLTRSSPRTAVAGPAPRSDVRFEGVGDRSTPLADAAPRASARALAEERPRPGIPVATPRPGTRPMMSVRSSGGSAEERSRLRVRVVDVDGAVVPWADVGLRIPERVGRARRRRADDWGEVTFGLDASEAAGSVALWAVEPARGRASRLVTLEEVPEEQPVLVVLEPGGWLDVTVLESRGGLPVPGASVFISSEDACGQGHSSIDTDGRGRAALGPLVPGLREWYVGAPGSEHNVRGAAEIELGERTEIEIALDADGDPLALEALFVDESGAARPTDPGKLGPIDHPSAWVGPSRANGRIVHADAYGRLRVHMPPCDEIVVVLNTGANGHRYEPESMTVPFGTRGLRFRIVERYERVSTRFDVKDADSGEPVKRANVVVYRDDPWTARESCLVRNGGPGRYVVEHRDWPGLRYVVSAQGYEHAYGDTARSDQDEPVVVPLRRGTRSPVIVVDAATLSPIAGARFVAEDGAIVATSDAEGAAVLEGDEASGRLRVVASGCVPRRWYASWPMDRVMLVRE
ncbi:MAG: carboxypeptidase-like regulatory domain-containing protein [Planctomycetota bacterium]